MAATLYTLAGNKEQLAHAVTVRFFSPRHRRCRARRVSELIAEGVGAEEFRDVNAAFGTDLAAAMMVRIQQRTARPNRN